MWRVLVELSVVLGAVGGLGLRITQYVVDRKVKRHLESRTPSADYEHVKQLEEENKELDEMLTRIRGERK